MSRFGKLRKLLKKEKKPKEKKPLKKEEEVLAEVAGEKEIDKEALSKIVGRLREKYIEEGILKEEEPKRAAALKKRLKGVREEVRVSRGTPKELALFESPVVRLFGKFYLILKAPISKLTNFLYNRFGKRLGLDLQASGSRFSVEQYLTLTLAVSLFIWLLTVVILGLLFFTGFVELFSAILVIIIIPIIVLAILLKIPSSNAIRRGNSIDKELPFALRHMSIEIRAGVGIYKTMESIANAGYGALSEDFKWVLSQVEKGVPTEDALQKWAERTRSDAVKRVVSHIVRALKTGGNLSDIMITIAEDVAFERKMKIADFAEKLNLLGLFLLMIAIVFPVMITILTTIASSPSIQQYLTLFSFFTPQFLMLIYFFICPALIGVFIYFVRASDPGA